MKWECHHQTPQDALEALRVNVKQLLLAATAYSEETIERKLKIEGECIVWMGTRNKDGYGRIYIPNTKSYDWKVHRVVWCAFNNQKIAPEIQLLHSCDNPPCCNPLHLRPGDSKENAEDRSDRNRVGRMFGMNNPQTKISDAQVKEIREMRKLGFLQREIGKNFGVSASHVSEILSGKKRGRS